MICIVLCVCIFLFFKQKTAYEMRISDWSSDVCSSDLATTIGFTVPIFATILSALILREATGIHRWTAVIIGFCGVLVMAQPTPGQFPATGVAVAVAAAISVATVSILLRQIGRTEATTTTVFWFTILSLPPLAIGMFFFGQAHDALTWG